MKKTSQLFMGSYKSNFLNRALGPKRVADGSFVLALPHSPDTPEPYVDPPSDTGKFVEALEKLGGGKKLFGVSDMRTCAEFMRVWSENVGVRGRFQEVSRDEFIMEVANVHEGLAKEVADSRGFNADFGWLGGEEDVLMPKDVSHPLMRCSVLADRSSEGEIIKITTFSLDIVNSTDSLSSSASRLRPLRSISAGRTGLSWWEPRSRVYRASFPL